MAFQNPPGVNDLLPTAAYGHQHLIRTAERVFGAYGYQYIELPTFEKTEVFTRGIGEATDVVGKEMYFVDSLKSAADLVGEQARLSEPSKEASDESGQSLESAAGSTADNQVDLQAFARQAWKQGHLSLALRPEGTAGLARAVVQHNLVPPGAPVAKLWYAGSMFRHERQQKGRYREFHQIGAECFGATASSADAELIIMLMQYFEALGIPRKQMVLKINTMGDDDCRPAFQSAVKEYILSHAAEFCPECLRRAETNPIRAFDCKNAACQELLVAAPKITDHLCEPCASEYAQVKNLLISMGMAFEEDPKLVRGLDYYTRTVFEVQVDAGLGSQNAIGGGGRYDKLLSQYGAKPTPSLGFAVGLERILMVLEALGKAPELPTPARVFIAAVDEGAREVSFGLATALRSAGIGTELDHQSRSLKSQFKVADKLGVRYAVVVGPDEIAQNRYTLRDMQEGNEQTMSKEELVQLLTER